MPYLSTANEANLADLRKKEPYECESLACTQMAST
jgi:hypothetical protein